MDLSDLTSDYRALLKSGQLSDLTVTIASGDTGIKEFRLHRTILGARSPVFMAMFTSDCKETTEARLTIEDITVEVFESLLEYIYAGVEPDLENYAMELFVVADKYQFESLKKQCGIFMESKLSFETVIQILIFADMHSDTELKVKCLDFIGKSPAPVRATASWQQLKEVKHADLLDEVIDAILEEHKAPVQTLSLASKRQEEQEEEEEEEEQEKVSVNNSIIRINTTNPRKRPRNNDHYYDEDWDDLEPWDDEVDDWY